MTQGRFHRQGFPQGLLDADHLARQTGGDAALAAEVLALFAGQLREALAALDAMPIEGVPTAMHRLKGSARGVGAFALAECAAALEEAPGDAAARQSFSDAAKETLQAISSAQA